MPCSGSRVPSIHVVAAKVIRSSCVLLPSSFSSARARIRRERALQKSPVSSMFQTRLGSLSTLEKMPGHALAKNCSAVAVSALPDSPYALRDFRDRFCKKRCTYDYQAASVDGRFDSCTRSFVISSFAISRPFVINTSYVIDFNFLAWHAS